MSGQMCVEEHSARLQSLAADLWPALRIFGQGLVKELDAAGLLDDISQVDHACFRVLDIAAYEEYKTVLLHCGELLSEAFINGRPIASYKLTEPVVLDQRFKIEVIELPAPKAQVCYTQGFEHIEVVSTLTLEALTAKHPEIRFIRTNVHAAVNRDIALQCAGGLVKFHEASLEAIIADEKIAIAKTKSCGHVFIDFDDTMAHTKAAFLHAAHGALEEFLATRIDFALVCAAARPTFPEFLESFGISSNGKIQELIGIFQKHWIPFAAECPPVEGMHSLLSCLYSEGVTIYVWTARDELTTQQFLSSHGLDQYISGVSAFDGLTAGKPIPTEQMIAMAKSSRSVLLGDSRSDMLGAKNLGAYFLQAAWVHEADLSASPDAVCRSPLEALSKIMAQFK